MVYVCFTLKNTIAHNNINVEDKLIRNLLNKSTFNARKYKSFIIISMNKFRNTGQRNDSNQAYILLFIYLLYKPILCTKRFEQLGMLFYYYFRKIKCTVLIRGPFKAQHCLNQKQKFIGEKNSMCPFCGPILAELIMRCKKNLTTSFLFLISKQR